MKYPVDEGSVRPFRLWNANEGRSVKYRYYSNLVNAHIGGMIEARWAKVGTTIEVIDISIGRLKGQYTRTVKSVLIVGGNNVR